MGLELAGKFAGILHTLNDSLADVVQSDRTDVLYGQDYFYEELLGLRFRISPFLSSRRTLWAQKCSMILRESYVGRRRTRWCSDLYSGTGTIAQILAPVAKKVVGVEIVEEAVKPQRSTRNSMGWKIASLSRGMC